jgi:hypothetical protein
MLTLALFRTLASAAVLIPWLLNLATRLLARSLNMPEPLLRETGALVFIQVQAVENSLGKRLCPIRLWRHVRLRFRPSARWRR